MYKEILRSIDNIEIYPIISLIIFLLFFVGMFIWVVRTPKDHIKHMESLPFDDQESTINQP
ncbi:MAG: cbb3-type cytochrome c oxidase subunit 3 [Algoriphagus sp.]|jgi:cbb3-type cytochrome oxidase subunit 3|uniref:cbb3-type cytochrome c oxidase subunit 3 n=1 Tax=Algoriphagus sp. TaxID=1872435 RepID=UPI0027284A65|nr:cbb3-type cytochrome c oxidase subunit 3 [Algoriphagus sp.]MDO8968638.1 cbb3-type cytochrome c oxidase subunit 3 [Algoriphagus sp.]MDP2039700.1 cbb3-type cytochrome c oxidase subunit 3 [Algoriphagus sp.]MDP3200340.1 cbb3-type cytochrome c oxidase subunit 3 [Algoriphagus sp.]MDP3471531.1 cbb3-type cytochrome c oxidase subunit 3 [Algoriphagus sp.]